MHFSMVLEHGFYVFDIHIDVSYPLIHQQIFLLRSLKIILNDFSVLFDFEI